MIKRLIAKLMILLFLLGMIISGINIVMWYRDNQKSKNIKEKINESVKEIVDDNQDEKEIKYQIDFEKLKSINSETVGYLKVNNTDIDYIVVKGADNKYYLKHDFNKENNQSGWIFMDYRNKLDGTDRNIIIYGHNKMDGSMFGTLKNVIKEEWYLNKENHIINLNLNGEEIKYLVFSTYSVPKEDYYIQTEFKNDKEFKDFLNVIKKRSIYNYSVDLSEKDNILTLSTCTGNGKKRMVLHAKKIDNSSFNINE